jgi:hypothetical protein
MQGCNLYWTGQLLIFLAKCRVLDQLRHMARSQLAYVMYKMSFLLNVFYHEVYTVLTCYCLEQCCGSGPTVFFSDTDQAIQKVPNAGEIINDETYF